LIRSRTVSVGSTISVRPTSWNRAHATDVTHIVFPDIRRREERVEHRTAAVQARRNHPGLELKRFGSGRLKSGHVHGVGVARADGEPYREAGRVFAGSSGPRPAARRSYPGPTDSERREHPVGCDRLWPEVPRCGGRRQSTLPSSKRVRGVEPEVKIVPPVKVLNRTN